MNGGELDSTGLKLNSGLEGVSTRPPPPLTWDDLKFPPINLHNIGEKK